MEWDTQEIFFMETFFSELPTIAYTILRFDEWLIGMFVFDLMHMLFVRVKLEKSLKG